ncbi:hypothetical protein FWP33_17010 [Vibrio parahaemolyticus]|uniref:Uncharacterized protein n=1 Tax=Vibrio parahaemolyticus TaxID=670 RepID=A0A9Q3U7R2_VIBPH|nr:hypothetical protein [Vibrio parahaemolyticus]EGQ9744201.1 hypothetical protein [Vibrio parahaemolyticus]MCC3803874.1 hypothetical protein [Vibrio parahaemolyticus]
MELWKVLAIWICSLLAKSIGFIWAVTELFGLEIGYSPISIAASAIFLFCVNGSVPTSNSKTTENAG